MEALSKLEALQLLRSLRPIYLRNERQNPIAIEYQSNSKPIEDDFKVFDEMQPFDRSSVEVEISEPTFLKWVHEVTSSG